MLPPAIRYRELESLNTLGTSMVKRGSFGKASNKPSNSCFVMRPLSPQIGYLMSLPPCEKVSANYISQEIKILSGLSSGSSEMRASRYSWDLLYTGSVNTCCL